MKPVPDDCPSPVPPDGEWAHAFDAGARRRRKGFDLPPRQRNYYNAWLRTGWTRQDELFSEYQLHMANRVRLHAGQKR